MLDDNFEYPMTLNENKASFRIQDIGMYRLPNEVKQVKKLFLACAIGCELNIFYLI